MEELCTKWQELLNMTPRIRLRDISREPIPYYVELSKIETNIEILETDIYRLIGIYVEFGRKFFARLVYLLFSEDEGEDLLELLLKYCLAHTDLGTPSRSALDIVQHFPFYVAEHLHNGRGNPPHLFQLLPRCLGSQEAYDIIPKSPQWEPLRMLWMTWYAYCKRLLVDPQHIKYVIPEVLGLSDESRQNLMNFFGIVSPSHFQVLGVLREILDEDGSHAFDGIPYIYFRLAFGIHSIDLYMYYRRVAGISSEE